MSRLYTGKPLLRYRPSGLVPEVWVCDDTPRTGANVLNTVADHFATLGAYLIREGDAFGAGAYVFGTDDPDANAANEDYYAAYGQPLPTSASEEERSQAAWFYRLPVPAENAPKVDGTDLNLTVGREAGPFGYRTWAAAPPSFEPVGVIDCASGHPYAAAVTAGMELDFSVDMATTIPHIALNNIQWYLYAAGTPSAPTHVGPTESFLIGSSIGTHTSSWTAPADGFVRIVVNMVEDGVAVGNTWDIASPVLAVA